MFDFKWIQGFLSKLSKREKSILYTTALVLSILLIDRLVIDPIYSKIKELNKEIEEKRTGIKKSLHVLAHKDRIMRESAKYKDFFKKSESIEEETTLILKEIEILANRSSVYIVDMKPSGLNDVGSSKRYFIRLNCEAQMSQLVDFMYNIENSEKLLSIEKYQVNPKSRESSIAVCNMSIYKILMQ
ncbi:MAG: hypothetical protein ABIG92_03555 [Candidatus Omnitrophota bacterium]